MILYASRPSSAKDYPRGKTIYVDEYIRKVRREDGTLAIGALGSTKMNMGKFEGMYRLTKMSEEPTYKDWKKYVWAGFVYLMEEV